MNVEYEWNPRKAIANRKKHGVDFADAVTVLEDERAVTILDEYSEEIRFITLGMDGLGRVLVVVYTRREDRIRLISSRKATEREKKRYEE